MGKKTKIGKARKDKFYHLAKESGYRSRAAFKLIQLNRTHEFLQRSRVLIDLCAAPGGWLQVAKQFMPVSSIIIGVDLVPIKSVANVITLQDDITTDHCRTKLRHELKTWKADVVLHDGAPNVGKNWIHDAFTQARLTLSAFKLATDFLCKGGWFITKIFRSKDYHALLWVFQQFFKKVVATKPPASRHESAEIFVVCSGYIAPDKIDPRLLDSRHVFEDVDEEQEDDGKDGTKKRTTGAAKLSLLMNPEKKKKSAEGYADDKVSLLLQRLPAVNYIDADEDRSKELLSQCHVITFDDEPSTNLLKDSLTTQEIRECCEDIKVLGKRELRLIINWRKKIRKNRGDDVVVVAPSEALVIKPFGEDEEEAEIKKQIEKVQEDERLDAKRKRKKLNKVRQQLQEKMNLKMTIPGDSLLPEEGQKEERLFALQAIKSAKGLEKIAAEDVGMDDDSSDQSVETDYFETAEDNPLLIGRETDKKRKARMMKEWFDKDIFSGIDLNSEEHLKKISASKPAAIIEDDGGDWEDESGDDSDEEMEFDIIKDAGDGVEVKEEKPVLKLDPEGFALAEELIKSKKRRREILEAGFHREAYSEPHDMLPSWLVDDEKKHCRKTLVDQGLVTKEQVQAYKDNLKAIDARPIKKVAEAHARKKRRAVKRLEKARKKANNILSAEGEQQLSSTEKMQQLKTIYKKAGVLGKKKSLPPTLVVSKKGGGTNRSDARPVKGSKIKVVDRRMKKDLRREKAAKGKKGKAAAKGKGKGKKGGKR